MYLKRKKEKSKKQNSSLSWATVEHYLSEKTDGSSAMALIETEKILGDVLLKLKYQGKNNEIRLSAAKPIIGNFEELQTAREVTRKLKEERDAQISDKEAKKALEIYFESIRFLTRSRHLKNSLFAKISIFVRKKANFFKKIFRNSIITFFLFFFIVFLLDSTKIGKKTVEILVNISHFLFSWILFTFLLLFGILIIIVSTFFYFEKKRKKKVDVDIINEKEPRIEIKD